MTHPARAVAKLLIALTFVFAVAGAPAAVGAAEAKGRLEVTVSILPQKYFVEKIGGDLVSVTVMVEPGAEPHVYDPKPQRMTGLTRSKIYFSVGAPFEDVWLDRFAAANPKMRIVRTDAGIAKLSMEHEHGTPEKEEAHTRPESAAREHSHGGEDPHVWTSPPLVMIQARHILAGLVEADPAHRVAYETNYRKFVEELVELDHFLLNLFQDRPKGEFIVFHPAWGYFAEAYNLQQVSIEIEGKEPKAADLQQLIAQARKRRIGTVFVQPQFSDRSAKVIAEAIGARVEFADPMSADWDRNLREFAGKIRASLH